LSKGKLYGILISREDKNKVIEHLDLIHLPIHLHRQSLKLTITLWLVMPFSHQQHPLRKKILWSHGFKAFKTYSTPQLLLFVVKKSFYPLELV